jgi:hypothetical protein
MLLLIQVHLVLICVYCPCAAKDFGIRPVVLAAISMCCHSCKLQAILMQRLNAVSG